jgi:transposase
VHGYRDKESRKARSKVIQSLGYLDELEKQYSDPVAYFKEFVAEMNKKEAEDKPPASVTFDRSERLKHGQDNRKNIGYAALSKFYHDLNLHTFFNNRARQWDIKYNVNCIMRLLIFSRILCPASKQETFEQRNMYYEIMDFALHDIYRCLSKVITLKRDLMIHLNNQMKTVFGRLSKVVYYDVTNFYFEIDEQDEMRKRGVSKQYRPDPIIQMGLLTDSSGIPITFETFPGNTLDCETYKPIFKQVRKDFSLGRIIIVADKGINTGDNIAHCVLCGNGYVFSQKVRGASKELKDYVLDERGYRYLKDGFKIKSRLYPRLIYVTNEKGEKVQVRLGEKQVVFYSPDYDKKAKAERAVVIAKAQELINDPSKYKRATSYGAAKYVKNLVFDKKTGEIVTSKQKPIFDEAKIIEEEKFDGYYAIVTSEMKETDDKILEIYRGLWQIEEAFRVCKGDLEARPVYLSRLERIDAHFMICFLALVIARLLARFLGNMFSVGRIAESLEKSSGSHMGENWYVFDHTDEVTDAIFAKMGIDLGKKYMNLGDIRHLIGDSKK